MFQCSVLRHRIETCNIVSVHDVCKTVLLSQQLESSISNLRRHSGIPQHGFHRPLLDRVRTQDPRLWAKGTVVL